MKSRFHTDGQDEEQLQDETTSLLERVNTPMTEVNEGRDNDDMAPAILVQILDWLECHTAFILMPVLPLAWCVLFAFTMTPEELSRTYAMPLLGIGTATLANSVPVGGGIVFVPILRLFGFDLKLGASFSVATMTFGKGVFGFLNWFQKDPASIVWRVVPYAVFPAWLGSSMTTIHPILNPNQCHHLFAFFCVATAVIVGRGIYIHKQRGNTNAPFSIIEPIGDPKNSEDGLAQGEGSNVRRILWASVCSFLAGFVLVGHIGIGNAMTTFLVCTFIWRLPAKQSMVTGIVCMGWTSIAPFMLHLFVLKDVPITLWVMVLPGVYVGAKVAPIVHERVGLINVLTFFCLFLVVIAVLMFSEQ